MLMMPRVWLRTVPWLVLTSLLETETFPSFGAKAETLSIQATGRPLTVQIDTATPYTPGTTGSMSADDFSDIIPRAASTQPDNSYAPQHTLVVDGETYVVHPGSVATLRASSATTRHTTPARTPARPTHTLSSTTRSAATDSSETVHRTTISSTPRHDEVVPNVDADRYIALGTGIALGLIAVTLAAVMFYMLRRRKHATGSFFKRSRFSLASAVGSMRNRPHTNLIPEIPPATLDEKPRGVSEEEQAAPAPFVPTQSTGRPVREDQSPRGYAAFMSRRQSVERLRSERLVSRGLWTEVRPYELEGEYQDRAELDAVSPTITPSPGRSRSSSTYNSDQTPTMRPTFVTYSMTTSSSGAPGSRGDLLRGDSRGESQDDVAPIALPMPSYRDPRPANLRLPTAANRFRHHRLLLPFQHDTISSPEISPFVNGQGPYATPTSVHGTPSPNFPHRVVAPMVHHPMVHYPSMSEVSGFEFARDSPLIVRSQDDDDGEGGWRPGGDSAFGRHELA